MFGKVASMTLSLVLVVAEVQVFAKAALVALTLGQEVVEVVHVFGELAASVGFALVLEEVALEVVAWQGVDQQPGVPLSFSSGSIRTRRARTIQ